MTLDRRHLSRSTDLGDVLDSYFKTTAIVSKERAIVSNVLKRLLHSVAGAGQEGWQCCIYELIYGLLCRSRAIERPDSEIVPQRSMTDHQSLSISQILPYTLILHRISSLVTTATHPDQR